MKIKILSPIFLATIATAIFIGCNSNSSNSNSKDSLESSFNNKDVKSDSLKDSIYTHRGIQENNSEVKK